MAERAEWSAKRILERFTQKRLHHLRHTNHSLPLPPPPLSQVQLLETAAVLEEQMRTILSDMSDLSAIEEGFLDV